MQTRIFSGFAAIIAVSLGVAAWDPGAQAAAITGASANVQIVVAPADVSGGGPLESTTHFIVFEERTTTVTSLAVDASAIGDSFGGAATPGSLTGAVTSFFVHYDPLSSATLAGGFLEFDAPILGLLWDTGRLDATDGLLGLGGTTYLPAGARGLDGGGDILTFTSASRIDFKAVVAGANVDSFRVLVGVAAVPEPGALAVFGLGLAALAFARRRRAA